jgi:hypothetical protein
MAAPPRASLRSSRSHITQHQRHVVSDAMVAALGGDADPVGELSLYLGVEDGAALV